MITTPLVPTIPEILDLEASRVKHYDKELLIRATWGINTTQYYRYLNQAITAGPNQDAALAHNELVTRRLLNDAASRKARRAAAAGTMARTVPAGAPDA